MTAKGIIIQAGILLLSTGLLVTLILLPKNYSVNKLKNDAQQEEKVAVRNDIDEVKKDMDKKDLTIITGFETQFGAAAGEEKIQWLDSIIRFWDKNGRYAISAVYSKDKGDLTGKTADYMVAGERFLGVAQYLDSVDKPWAYKEAKKIFEMLVEKDPENADAQINLAICYMNDMDPENPMKGITILRSVVEKNPKNTRAILQLGHFSVISGQYSKAIDRYQQALEIDPGLNEAYFHLGDTYAKMGEMDKADKYWSIYRGLLESDEEKNALDKYIEDFKIMSNN